ncbi:Flp pilus assembly protein CpaB [Sinosporangium siamense]|uniref:SAF domain-containing protein n=1 Tax=Sinosporangium siamense TaxID=1367973 RepID=A0A919VE99_9ACTN|nr:RcpC/CpaB family pilus assembly protein [Sinosporangium siamense]GII94909.1 hypothetical protein Ssi02_51400 [Sinosporangium siamense]
MRRFADTWKRRLSRHRRLLAIGLTGLAAITSYAALRPPPAPTEAVLAAARDLRAGPLRPGDLTTLHLPTPLIPDGTLRPGSAATHRPLVAPMRRGEPLTDARLLSPGMLSGYGAGTVAMPVRISDPEAVRLLSPGDLVDVLAAPSQWDDATPAPAQTVADNARVITTRHDHRSGSGALVVLATTADQASRLAGAQQGTRLSVMIEPQP